MAKRVLTDQAKQTAREQRNLGLSAGRTLSIEIDASSSKKVQHGLGRYPVGWIVTDFVADAAINRYLRRTAWDAQSITLANDAATAITLKVLVF